VPERPRLVDLDLWGSRCTVRLRAEGETVDLKGHWFTDCFTELNSAARGKLLFEARVPLKDFVRDFLRALQRIRVLTVDAGGLPAHWPHTFPQCLYEDLERTATRRFGYHPPPNLRAHRGGPTSVPEAAAGDVRPVGGVVVRNPDEMARTAV
jgi:hypothetical protein